MKLMKIFSLFFIIFFFHSSYAIKAFNKPQEIKAIGTIEVAFSPNNGVTSVVVNAINQAKKQILVEAYSFTSKPIANAIVEAKRRGVDIWILLDKTQNKSGYSVAKFFYNHGISKIKIDQKHAIFHNKIMIIDNENLITGSFNFTKAAEEKNAENLLYFKNNKDLTNIYIKEFAYNWNMAIIYRP
jgi:phosphatidylserine/phosphatidylglycerophosphate/cardiolipin synthase-like enzyme